MHPCLDAESCRVWCVWVLEESDRKYEETHFPFDYLYANLFEGAVAELWRIHVNSSGLRNSTRLKNG